MLQSLVTKLTAYVQHLTDGKASAPPTSLLGTLPPMLAPRMYLSEWGRWLPDASSTHVSKISQIITWVASQQMALGSTPWNVLVRRAQNRTDANLQIFVTDREMEQTALTDWMAGTDPAGLLHRASGVLWAYLKLGQALSYVSPSDGAHEQPLRHKLESLYLESLRESKAMAKPAYAHHPGLEAPDEEGQGARPRSEPGFADDEGSEAGDKASTDLEESSQAGSKEGF